MSAAFLIADHAAHEIAEPLPVPARAIARVPVVELDVVTTREGFNALEADWNELFAHAGASTHLFQSFNWLWHWCNHYLPSGDEGQQLFVVTARSEGRLVMAWPLVRERVRGLTILSWMGDPVGQYGDALVAPGLDAPALLERAWSYISRKSDADIVRLRKVRADAVVAPLLTSLGGRITEELAAPYLDLASAKGFEAYEQRYAGSARRNRRRLYRRLDEQGTITFEEHTEGPAARDLIHLAVELKRKWLAARGLVSKAYADDRFAEFFADVAGAETRPAGCRVAVLKSAGRPVAIEVAIGCRERMALHIIVFDLELEKSGAGVLLLEQSIRNASNRGLGCYDLLAPADEYKKSWADGAVAVQDWALPLSIAGQAYASLYLGFAREQGKRIVEALPTGLRRHVAGELSRLISRA